MATLSAHLVTCASFANSSFSASAASSNTSPLRLPSKIARHVLAVSLLVLVVLGAAAPGLAATYTVNSTADSGTGSLRAALGMAANGDTINFKLPYPATITLTSGYLEISTDVTISGPGTAYLFIDGGRASQVFQVDSTVTGVGATISGVTIENGFNSTSSGGGISNYGTLAVTDSSLVKNGGGFLYGGGIYNNGTMTVSNCSLVDNESSTGGGGIFNDTGGTMTVSNSSLSGNESVGLGGGIGNVGMLTVTDSTLSGNVLELEGEGGGIGNGGTLIMSNSTVSGNIAYPFKAFPGQGGGIFNDGTATISFSTIVGNAAYSEQGNSGGGISQTGGTLTLKSTLLANNSAAGNCSGAGTSDGYNLSDDSSCTFLTATGDQNDVTNAATYLGPLQNNGGPTSTIALLGGSPGSTAINAIPVSPTNECTDAFGVIVTTDQRGVTRPQGSGCDIGAYELAPQVTAAPSSVAFGSVKVCQTKKETITLIDDGPTLVQIGPITIIDVIGNPGDFSFRTYSTDNILGPKKGHSFTIAVEYSPTELAPESATLNIVTNAPGSPLQVPITGTGIAAPKCKVE
jgi:hypothetical protein